jgi:dipeptidase E
MESYVLAQARKPKPSICFLATGSADSDSRIVRFYEAFSDLPCKPSHLRLFGRTPDLQSLLSHDIIYIGGGNTKSMLAVWREWAIPKILRKAWTGGIVLAGVSAGAICWFEACITDSWAGRYAPLPGLGFLSGVCCPHYDSEPGRQPVLRQYMGRKDVRQGLALDDGVAAHFVGLRLFRAITSRTGAGAYRLNVKGGKLIEEHCPITQLPTHV